MIAISTKPRSPLLAALCAGSALVSFSCAFYALHSVMQRHKAHRHALLIHAQQKSDAATQTINQFINNLMPLVTTTAKELSQGILNRGSTEHIVQRLKQKPHDLSGFGIAFATSKAPEASYYVEHNDKQELFPLMNFIHFGAQDNWYKTTMQSSGGYFGPLQDPITNRTILLYAKPFYDTAQKPIGVVFATLSLDYIRHVLSTLYVNKEGYSYIVDKDAKIVIHPSTQKDDRAIHENKIDSTETSASLTTIQEALAHPGAPITYYDQTMTSNSWLFSHPVTTMGWSLISSFDQQSITNNDAIRHTSIVILLYFLLGLFFLICIIPCLYFYDDTMIWLASSLIACIFLGGIMSMWCLAIYYPSYNKHMAPITSKSELYHFLDTFKKTKTVPTGQKRFIIPPTTTPTSSEEIAPLLHYRYKEGKYIPTGFLINDIHFSDVDQIEFVGYIWQRYFDGIHEGISRGFIFPQMADTPTITQISEIKKGNTQTIIWQVRSKLNQEMDYSRYPFDTKDIQLHVRHKDFDKNIILVPDLDAYQVINPSTLPGVARTTHMTGWYLIQSFFGYELSNYTTNFGLYSYGPFGIYQNNMLTNTPELYFNITTNRYLIDTIVTNVLVLVIIALILFILLLIYSLEGFGWIIGTVASTLFSTILAQVNFRSKVPSQTFVYFEMFYFVFYFIIMLTLISSLLHQFKVDIRFISYRKNIITKVLYWPLLLGLIFVATLYYLY